MAGAISASYAMIMTCVQHAMKQELQLHVIRQNIQCSASLQGLILVSVMVLFGTLFLKFQFVHIWRYAVSEVPVCTYLEV